jgi:hypothetical protein
VGSKLGLLAARVSIYNQLYFEENGLSKDSAYTVFLFLLIVFFPSVLDNVNLVVANFFILLAFHRLISLQSLKASKEKIFDASFWIIVAALFQFWSILYLVLVFISIIFMFLEIIEIGSYLLLLFFAASILFFCSFDLVPL